MPLTDYFWLPRAGRYSSAFDNNARLPIVLGDSGSAYDDPLAERWELPCINVNRVSSLEVYGTDYCYSLGEVYDSSSVRIYIDHALVSTAKYTINSTHYESQSHITKITFSTGFPDLTLGQKVTAQGMGVKEATGGTTNANTPGLIIKTFLTQFSSYSASVIDDNSYNNLAVKFPFSTGPGGNLSYFGVINEDETHWNILQRVAGSIGGRVYLNNLNRLVITADATDLAPRAFSEIISKSEISFQSAQQKEVNLINQCPVSFDYSNVEMEFKHHDNGSTGKNSLSQNIYGKQEPHTPLRLYWVNTIPKANKIQEIIVNKFALPIWEIEIKDETLKRCGLDVGDIIVTSIDELYQKDGESFTNRVFEVLGIKPDFVNGAVDIRIRDTGYNLTETGGYTTSTAYDKTEY